MSKGHGKKKTRKKVERVWETKQEAGPFYGDNDSWFSGVLLERVTAIMSGFIKKLQAPALIDAKRLGRPHAKETPYCSECHIRVMVPTVLVRPNCECHIRVIVLFLAFRFSATVLTPSSALVSSTDVVATNDQTARVGPSFTTSSVLFSTAPEPNYPERNHESLDCGSIGCVWVVQCLSIASSTTLIGGTVVAFVARYDVHVDLDSTHGFSHCTL